jgi:threonine/homoserine/homoserine lactone efflux protein
MRLLPFMVVALVITVTPGIDMALVTRNALRYGRKTALTTPVGINLGVSVWALAATVGLAAVVAASAVAFNVIRLCGALYLVWLGLRALGQARRAEPGNVEATLPSPLGALRQGFLSNLFNPKMAIFFTSLLPQFVGRGSAFVAFAVLGASFTALGFAWLSLYAVIAARGRALLQRPRVKAALDYLSGFVLIGLGTRIALERGI